MRAEFGQRHRTALLRERPFIEKTQCEIQTKNYECKMMHDMLDAKKK